MGSVARAAYVQGNGEVIKFEVANSETGSNELDRKLRAVLAAAPRKPLVCIGAGEGSSASGVVFERAVFDESVRRFYVRTASVPYRRACGVFADR